MINQTLLSLLAAITIFSANIHTFVLTNGLNDAFATEETKDNDYLTSPIESMINELFNFLHNPAPLTKDNEKAVTTSEESREAVTENESTGMVTQVKAESEEEYTPEEKQQIALKTWQESFPTYDSDSHQTQFIETIAPAAVLIAETYGIYPSVMIAQAALESSWGQSGLAQSYNNLMGTKGSWKGESVTVSTREDVNGQSVYINAGFSVYDSWAESLGRYGQLMKNGVAHDPEIYTGTQRENAKTYQEATAWLQGRYATDTAYAKKLNQTIESFNLNQYDDIETKDFDLEETLPKLGLSL